MSLDRLTQITSSGISSVSTITVSAISGNITATTATVSGNLSGNTASFSGNITGTAASFSSNVNIAGILTCEDITNVDSIGVITARSGVIGNLSGNVNSVGVSTFNNVVVGGATTALIVSGNARITGILTVGTGSITINGNTDTIAGVNSVTDNLGGYISIPPGAVQFFARNTAPNGWIKANGATISRSAYSSLFAAVGTTFGSGDGSTTFGVPDLRGEFPRGWDDGRGADSGRAFGTAQNATRVYRSNAVTNEGYGGSIFDIDDQISADSDAVESLSFSNRTRNAGSLVSPVNATVTGVRVRPRNIALLACIKY